MPISHSIPGPPLSQDEFARLDYRVMRHAFECQNQLGRLCDEVIYQNDLTARLQADGLSVRTEVPVTVTHEDFSKTYSLDLVVADTAIYELKTALRLAGEHDTQILNYLFLCGQSHGKLVNFRPERVESKFVNTTLTPTQRREIEIQTDRWQEQEKAEEMFRTHVCSLLEDWGGWLDFALYAEAVTHFFGGEQRVLTQVPLTRDGVYLGKQRFHMLTPETAFRLTALTEGAEEYERHLRSMLRLSPIRAIQWVNLARRHVQFVSLVR